MCVFFLPSHETIAEDSSDPKHKPTRLTHNLKLETTNHPKIEKEPNVLITVKNEKLGNT